MSLQTWWRAKTRNLKREVFALYLACRDPRVPWYAKVLAAGVVAYAFSPIDLIPDFIPVVGYLDELVLVPLGVLAVRAMIPAAVLAECRERAETALEPGKTGQRARRGHHRGDLARPGGSRDPPGSTVALAVELKPFAPSRGSMALDRPAVLARTMGPLFALSRPTGWGS